MTNIKEIESFAFPSSYRPRRRMPWYERHALKLIVLVAVVAGLLYLAV